MRTQTIIESPNVIADDYNNFSKFSKEELISSLFEEANEDQPIAIPNKACVGPNDSIAKKPGTIESVAT